MPRNALAGMAPPTVDNAVYEMFGMQPGMDRLNLLPRHDKKLGWIAPNALYQAARALVSPSVAAQGGYVSPEDAVNFAGNVSLGGVGASAAMRNPAPGPGKTLPMTVYHGSPHNFDAFDISKIGTGEGAQAYGHGLYVAESPDVAKRYRDTLTNFRPDHIESRLTERGISPQTANTFAGFTVQTSGGGRSFDDFAKLMSQPGPSPAIEKFRASIRAELPKLQKELAAIQGSLYHVDLPDQHIANMLDWDKPLSQQPQIVQKLQKAGLGDKDGLFTIDGHKPYTDTAGGDAYQSLMWEANQVEGTPWAQGHSNPAAAASSYLNSLGIPGIRYLDGGSRGAGQGTRNYVVFDDKLLRILKKE